MQYKHLAFFALAPLISAQDASSTVIVVSGAVTTSTVVVAAPVVTSTAAVVVAPVATSTAVVVAAPVTTVAVVVAGVYTGNPYAQLSTQIEGAVASVSETAPNAGNYHTAIESINAKASAVAASISVDIMNAAASINATAMATGFAYETVLAQASAIAATMEQQVAATLFNAAPMATMAPGLIAAVGGAAAMLLL